MSHEPEKAEAEKSEWKHFWNRIASVFLGGIFLFIVVPVACLICGYLWLIHVVRPEF